MKNRRKKINTFIICLISFITTKSLAKDFVIATGENKTLALKGNTIWIEKKNVITGQVKGNSLIITGKEVGASYVKIKDELIKFQVVKPQNYFLFKKINSLLSNKIGLKAETKNSAIIVSGSLYKLTDWIDLSKLISADEEFLFKANIEEALQEEAESYFNKLFADQGLPEQKIQINNNPLLRIHPQDPHFKDYEEILNPYGIKVIKDKTALSLAPVIKVQITVAEINRGFAQNYGVDFSDSYQAEILPTTKIKDFEAKLHFLESSGNGKLLASPNIICRSGKEAEFLAGGEFPIKVRSKFGGDIVWKKYGVLLKVNPKADSLGRMSIGIQSEVSSIDKSLSIDGIPAISTNKVSSYFDLTGSKIIALSGLLTDVRGDNYSGFPVLSRLPIIGSLFSSRDFLNKRTELMIFVKPSIMKMNEDYSKAKNKINHLGNN
jgi:pilus assembly protein CpaC